MKGRKEALPDSGRSTGKCPLGGSTLQGIRISAFASYLPGKGSAPPFLLHPSHLAPAQRETSPSTQLPNAFTDLFTEHLLCAGT